MTTYDASTALLLVFTFKEGFAAAIAHDLKLAATRFTIDVDEDAGAVAARIDAGSLRVETAMRDGREAPSLLAPSDHRKIEGSIAEDVLHAGRYPEISFRGAAERSGDRATVRGALTLAGHTRDLAFEARREGGRWIADVVLHQPDWGIRPYTALLGALRVKADVRVRVSVPAR